MLIWSRWGILGLLVPVLLIVMGIGAAETLTKPRARVEERKPVQKGPASDSGEEAPPEPDAEEDEAAQRKRVADERKRVVEGAAAKKRAEGIGYLIGGLASAAVLWPLGRQMNKSETHTLLDPQTGQFVEAQVGGGHTMFFIPLEYWGFIWAVIGLFKFAGSSGG